MERYVMGWSQADNGWMVVYADDYEEAEAKFENGEFTIEDEGAEGGVRDKAGHIVYVTTTPDCEDNPDGFYCETYSDEECDHKIDDFVIRPEDIPGFYQMTQEERSKAIDDYIASYYLDEVLDLDFDFDGF